jgi:SAM-dependent methyltransferase
MKCKICQSNQTTILRKVKSPHSDLDYYLYYCLNCKSRFFNPLEHDVDFQEFYQTLSQNHQATRQPVFQKKKSWIDLRNKLIKILGNKPASILDVGCRTGDFLLHFDDDIHREGVELAEDFAQIARERGLVVYNDFIENIRFNKKYDIVSCLAILEHLVDPNKFLDTINDLVEKDGLLVILVPTFECLKEKILFLLNIRWHMYRPPEHLNFFSRSYLNEFMIRKGFYLVRREFTSGGLMNPFSSNILLRKIIGKIFYYYDRSPLNRLPIFDHMYSIYVKH